MPEHGIDFRAVKDQAHLLELLALRRLTQTEGNPGGPDGDAAQN